MRSSSSNDPVLLTGPVEDYLKTIYELEARSGAAATSEIAARLSLTPASVTGMVRRLARQGLLTHEPYRGVRLTELGRRNALRILHRHRILETYLSQVLGFPWDEVHEEAERLEHAASDALIERMAAALEHPESDPHGAPIPTADGKIDERSHIALSDLDVGESAVMVRVSDKNPSMLRYLAEIGLQPGVSLRLLERAPFDGPITVRIAGSELAIGPSLAAQVLVVHADFDGEGN